MKNRKFVVLAGVLAVGLVGAARADDHAQKSSTLLDQRESFDRDAKKGGHAYGHEKQESDADDDDRDHEHGHQELPFGGNPVTVAIDGDHDEAETGQHPTRGSGPEMPGNSGGGVSVGVTGRVLNGPAPVAVPDQGGTVTLLLIASCGLLAARRRIISQI